MMLRKVSDLVAGRAYRLGSSAFFPRMSLLVTVPAYGHVITSGVSWRDSWLLVVIFLGLRSDVHDGDITFSTVLIGHIVRVPFFSSDHKLSGGFELSDNVFEVR